jgi:hypothetical protein
MTMRLPNPDRAILDIRKIEDYCLSASHPRGRHKARVFREALELERGDAAWLRGVLLEAARSSEAQQVMADLGVVLACRCDRQATGKERCGKDGLDSAERRRYPEIRHLLGVVMGADKHAQKGPSLLDVVALLADIPAHRLARGQVGTVIEPFDDDTVLVEFSDDQGRAYAVTPCSRSDLLVLHYVPEAA